MDEGLDVTFDDNGGIHVKDKEGDEEEGKGKEEVKVIQVDKGDGKGESGEKKSFFELMWEKNHPEEVNKIKIESEKKKIMERE